MPTRAIFQRVDTGETYEMTDQDIEWMARGLYGEKHKPSTSETEASAICWTWMQRFMLWPSFGMSKWGTLKKLIRGQSQPVNPIWRRDGWKCASTSKYYGQPPCSSHRLDWRDKMQLMPKSKIPLRMMQFAERMAAGELPNFGNPEFIDFASTAYAQNHGYQVDGGEWFLTKQASSMSGWGQGPVEIVGQQWRRAGLSTGEKLALGVGLGLMSWAAYRLWFRQ